MKYESNFVRTMRRSLRLKKCRSVTITNNNVNNNNNNNINNNNNNNNNHVENKYDSFVNSQEWTLSRAVPDLRLGIVGSLSSGKSALVHRYLTGSYMQEESPEGGRFKKEIVLDGQSYLLLIRDEGGPPEFQFTSWVDAVIFVFSLDNESSFNAIYSYYTKMAHFRNTADIPLVLVGTQDAISDNSPRVIDDSRARKLAADLKRCSYYETCATYGFNVERVFQDACSKIVSQRLSNSSYTPTGSRPSTPTPLLRYPSANNGHLPGPGPGPGPFPVGSAHPGHSGPNNALPPLSHNFTNAYSKPDGGSQSSFKSNPSPGDLSGVNRAESFREEAFKRASAPVGVAAPSFMAPPSPASTPGGASDFPPPPTPTSREFPTPASTPTTARKSRRKSNLFTPSKKSEEKAKNNGELGSGRAIPIKQGYLYKKSNKALNKDWKKKYVTLGDNGRLTYHANIHDYMEASHGKEISLQYTTVKVPGMKPRGSRVVPSDPLTSELNSLNLAASSGNLSTPVHSSGVFGGRPSLGGLNNNGKDKDKVLLTSYETLHDHATPGTNGTESATLSSKLETPNAKKRHRRMKSSGVKECDDYEGYEFSIVSLDNKTWHFEAPSQEERDGWVSAIEQQILTSLQGNESHKTRAKQANYIDPQTITFIKNHIQGNDVCADCSNPNPEWASINFGILLCIECSGVHRNLGSHLSKVRSLELDDWPPGPLAVMRCLGNEFVNSVWEARAAAQSKPVGARTDRDRKEKWIRSKYETRDFLAPPLASNSVHEQMVECVCRGDVRGLASLLPHGVESVNNPINPPRDFRSLLHLAAALPSLASTQLLLWNNANPKLLDSEGRSCLFYAKASKDKDVIDLLVQSGCPDTGSPGYTEAAGTGPAGLLLPSTLPRSKGSVGRKPEILDKLQASVI